MKKTSTSEALLEFLIKQDTTPAKIAIRSGVALSTINRILAGEDVRINTLNKIAKAYNMQIRIVLEEK